MNQYSNFFWLNLYGSHPDKSKSKYGHLMDVSPNIGSFWKGRLLLSIECFQENSPVLSDPNTIEKISSQVLKTISMGNTGWQLIADVFYGFSFPQKDKTYSIKIRWGERELVFDECKIEQGVLTWNQRKSIICDFPYTYEELPDILIYLSQGVDLICFIRQKFKDLKGEPQLYYFIPDKSIEMKPPIRKHNAGVVKLGFNISSSQISGVKEVKQALEKKELISGMLISHIYLAQDLIPADSNGSSDPFYKISYYGKEIKGETVMKSLNPVIFYFF